MKDPKIDYSEVKRASLEPLKYTLKTEFNSILEQINDSKKLFESYENRMKRVESKNGKAKYINETDWLKSSLFQLIENCYPPLEIISIEDFFQDFFKNIESTSSSIAKELKCFQEEDRFKTFPNDSLQTKFKKFIKRIGFAISSSPQHFLNFFSKEKKAIKPWSHNVPLRRIYIYFFKELLISKGLEYYEKIYLQRTKVYQALWEIDKNLNSLFTNFLESNENSGQQLIASISEIVKNSRLDSYSKEIHKLEEESNSDLTLIFNDLVEKAEDAIAKVDTLELSKNRFSSYRIKGIQKQNKTNFLRIENGWRNTLFSQLDDFELDLELFHFKYLNLKQQSLVNDSCSLRITSTIADALSLFDNQFDNLENEINKIKSKKALFELLSNRKEEINKKLELVIIPKASDAILNQNLPGLIERMENSMQKQILKIKEKRLIYPQNNYHSPTKSSELNELNPREIIEISIYKPSIYKFQELKASLVHKLEELQISINDLSHIIDYNLESAIEANKEETSLKDIVNISIEGIERVNSKLEEIKSSLKEVETWLKEQLDLIIVEVNNKLIELTDEESIIKIKLELARTKALEKSKTYKKQIILKVKNLIPTVINFSKTAYQKVYEKIDFFLKQSGLRKEDAVLSSELSDFLTETEKVLGKLPYVYRRLYQIFPLEDNTFFVGREKEIADLNNAFHDWQKGLFSPTIIHGEKGSGTSSLINNFVNEINGLEVYRYRVSSNITTEAELHNLLNEFLKTKETKSIDDLIEIVNKGKKKVFIIEQCHNLFLRKIGGFQALEKILEFITATSYNVFWLLEINSFSYQYLNKTIIIEQYFKHVVALKSLDDNQIVDLILKRHRVSGYNIDFLPNGLNIQEKKKIKKLTKEERQEFLKKLFFTRLNEFSQSNISLALLFWLRSTRKVEKNTIYLERLPRLKFEFLKTLKDDVVFTLYILVLHSSISSADYAIVMQIPEDRAKRQLLVLEERGVLRLEEGLYRINHLLYRQIVSMLRNRNIIH